MRAGVARVTITPPVGVDLCGYIARDQPSLGVLDDLHACALFIESGGERLLWVHADLIGFDDGYAARVRAALAGRLGLERRQVILSATHTHSGPATVTLRGCGDPDPAYLAMLERYLTGAALAAARTAEPVTLHFAEGSAQVSCDRRTRSSHSHTDPHLPVLALRRPDGTFLAVVANYAVHNVALSHGNRLISADLAGVAARHARHVLPGRPAVLLTNGGCGNLNPASRGMEPMRTHGTALGAAIVQAVLLSAPCSDDGDGLASREEHLLLPLDVLTEAQVRAEAARILDGGTAGPEDAAAGRQRRAMTAWRDETLAALAAGPATSRETDLQILRIGPATFVGIGAEVFSRLADDLRQVCGPRVYVVGYANGDLGYLPFREAYAEGGYEIEWAHRYYTQFRMAPGAFEILRERAVAGIAALDAPLGGRA
ncbi:MAG: Neutral ceramidase precursor [Lentisphaerae bacterium ADurb.BinA184]|nr:MAG: Neutral ceramidase precursor [Lentisphaerae bacterium ADurb.BinA184]